MLLAQLETTVPEPVRTFIIYFHRCVSEKSLNEIQAAYDQTWPRLTEKFYSSGSWPEAELIAPLVQGDEVFLTLYREVYFRHIYSRLEPNIEQRFHSYENYCTLFNYILNSEGPVPLELPNQWLWDMVDEFIYQFQSFSQWRAQPEGKSEEEVVLLQQNPQVWNTYSVLNVLYSLVQKSAINEQLVAQATEGQDVAEVAGPYGSLPLYRMLGYFSLIGLVRVHCLLGDYVLALKTLDHVDLTRRTGFSRVTACHVTTFYYVSFAYLMIGRHADAVRNFSHILVFMQRAKQYNTRSYQYDLMSRKADQMHALLAMAVALSPARLDEGVHSTIREKFSDQTSRLARGGQEALQAFESLFNYASPKFITPNAPALEEEGGAILFEHQRSIFLTQCRRHLLAPILRSYLRLYTSLGVEKLSVFLDLPVEELRIQLLNLKMAGRQLCWTSGSLLDGERVSGGDLDFSLDQDVIQIAESKVGRRYGDWFLRNCSKFEDLAKNLETHAQSN
ncbi:RNA polymerase I-associated factor PAF67-domain-containing protein [Piptocephalis cylindrospora]|uniref:Eukaryotic translation initiation factor 3 subunit L n=1 Tax=Piptocephalis cylindrospora TaxID=1907219 RepID=A0A4P9XZY6_9FUNG|nr:RNA polymerase I-associated factor PAF67-domain-containing protein [Piptocephalis cylindrospora]|eukprot:RKP12078.1 RNA polymerase I-associated factor PAF67-domain-containing protein [Piptocephalis cylindrospora]